MSFILNKALIIVSDNGRVPQFSQIEGVTLTQQNVGVTPRTS